MLRNALLGLATAALLTGCMSIDLPEGSYAARGGLGSTSERIAERIRVCWFQLGDTAFAAYRQETEITSMSGQPRILLVNRDDRGGLPQLVVTMRTISGAGTVVSSFGPLTETPLVNRINADLSRWARGSRACGAAA
ncbi:hypothetical protein ABWH92_11660 [Ahrensia marina]|uniref:hypothetical protein n=1 Tax=Ahrensia marina TaxID=1514904 RepID=UPI0035CF4F9F